MKNAIMLMILVLFPSALLFSQITLEHDYDGTCTLGKLSTGDYKYVYTANGGTTSYIYNVNHTLYKSVALSFLPGGAAVSSTANASDILFATDNLIEFTVSYYVTSPSLTYTTVVLNENGTVLKTINNCSYAYPVSAGANGAKLLCSMYNGASTTSVYSLPGQIVSAGPVSSDLESLMPNAYPNPASTGITIPCQLPENIPSATLVVCDILGNSIQTYNVGGLFNSIILNTNEFANGTYTYTIFSENWRSETMKFVVEK